MLVPDANTRARRLTYLLTLQARQAMLGSEVVSVGRYNERVRESGKEIKRSLARVVKAPVG